MRDGDGEQMYPDGSNFKGHFALNDKAGQGNFQDGLALPGTTAVPVSQAPPSLPCAEP